jgi:hypothetical protein
MNRLREMNVRVLLNTRMDLNSIRTSSSSPYPRGTPMDENARTPDLSPTPSTSEFYESPCPTPPPVSLSLPSFTIPPPLVQTEDLHTTITTTDGRKINADLIVGLQ